MARTPNEGYHAVAAASGASEDPTLTWAEGDLPASFDATNAQVLVWAGYNEEWDGGKNYNWEASLLPVSGVDFPHRTLSLSGRTIRTVHEHNRYYARGAREFLDAPGEFCVAEGVLYYRPRALPISDQEILASTTRRAIQIGPTVPELRVRDITIENLTVELSQAQDAFGPPQYLTSDGLIWLNRAEGITIRNCRLRNAGVAAIALDRENVGHAVSGNLIEGCGYSGVCVKGLWVGTQTYADEVESHVSHDHTITNNTIRRCGRLIGQASGVWLYESGENEISHNLIEGMPRYGVRVDGTAFDSLVRPKDKGGYIGGELFGKPITFENHLEFLHSRNNRIVFNEIRECMGDSQDGGGITTFGTGAGNVIANNLVHHFRSEVVEGSHAGIYLDDASNLFTVERNIVARIVGSNHIFPLIIKGCDNVVRNNIIANCEARAAIYVLQTPHGGLSPELGIQEEPVERLRFSRNILFRNAGLVYMIFPWGDSIIAESDHNVVYRPDAPLHQSIDWKWETWETWTGYFDGRYEQNTSLEDPLFIDPDALDFALADDSPALKLGFESIDTSAIGLLTDYPFADEIREPNYDW